MSLCTCHRNSASRNSYHYKNGVAFGSVHFLAVYVVHLPEAQIHAALRNEEVRKAKAVDEEGYTFTIYAVEDVRLILNTSKLLVALAH